MKKKRARTNWSKVEQHINSLGIHSPRQLKKIRVVNRFLSRNRMIEIPVYKHLSELTLAEFISVNAKDVLKATGYNSAQGAEVLMKSNYIRTIIGALHDNLDGINIEGIEMVRFRTEYMDLVKRYCREKKIVLD